MIVLGADTHKRSHTIAAVSAATGELVGGQTVQVGTKGFAALLVWARGLQGERVWAIEDCRHVSGSFERFLIGRGERVLQVTTRLMAASRRGARERGKSDSIDAVAVARGLDQIAAQVVELVVGRPRGRRRDDRGVHGREAAAQPRRAPCGRPCRRTG